MCDFVRQTAIDFLLPSFCVTTALNEVSKDGVLPSSRHPLVEAAVIDPDLKACDGEIENSALQ
jgi:hypothetical protein